MTQLKIQNKMRLASVDELHPEKTFECGQCFRWNADESGVYTGVAGGRAARVWADGADVFIDADETDYHAFWHDYFDLGLSYEPIRRSFDAGEYLKTCAEYGRGIRILRQDRWEALCSFIISQCNNIPRIKGIVETFCREFGEPMYYNGRTLYAFPGAETVAHLELEDLSVLRCGYRAPYILNAARAVASGELDLGALAAGDLDSAIHALRRLKGVGEKVANCVILFGLNKMEAFPIDVWMKRALKENFPPGFDPGTLGPYAGLAQQYIFYYARSMGK